MSDESVVIDHESLLVAVPGDATLDAVEIELAGRGLTLGAHGAPETTVRAWLASGAPGAPSSFADPADHLLAGFEATLPNGDRLVMRPSPRRAVGPDLAALVLGTGARFARVERAWLRVHRKDARRAAYPLPSGVDLDPPLDDAESRLLDAIATELRPT